MDFTDFENLPDYDTPWYSSFYDEKDGILSPLRHWCLVGEVKEFVEYIRPRVSLKLKNGKLVIVHFYHEKTDHPTIFKWSEIKKGKTMAILYAKRRQFMDFSVGIRQEHLDSVYIFNASLETLFQTAAEITNKTKKCWYPHCINEPSECVYFRCTRCLTALYCGKGHQELNWKQHKMLCSQLSVLTRLLEISKLPFSGHYDFHFNLDDFSDETKEMKRAEAMDEFMIKHGIYASKPLQKRAFEKLLAHFVANPDWIRSVTDITGNEERLRMLFPQEFRDTVAAKALLEACLKLESGASNAIIDFTEMEEFSIMSLSLLPFWASQILPDMAFNWYIQVDSSLTERLYGTGGWTKLGPSRDQSVFSHKNGSSN